MRAPDVALYLHNSGWEKRQNSDRYYTYRIYLGDSWDEVFIPKSNTCSDYSERIIEAIDTIAKYQDKQALEILSDIILCNYSDSLQYRIDTRDGSGTIPINTFDRIIEAQKDISTYAYLDMSSYKPYHLSKKSGQKAIENMRVGQTSYGSYVVRFVYPYAASGQTSLFGEAAPNDPLMRQIVPKIMDASSCIVETAVDGLDSIPEKKEISFNYIDSFLSLRSDTGTPIEMKRIRSTPAKDGDPSDTVSITDSVFKRVAEIADGMRPKELSTAREFKGRIYAASDQGYDDSDPSKFRIEYFDEIGTSKAMFALEGRFREEALEAMKRRSIVSFGGTLRGFGRSKSIDEIADFRIV
ncbi:MAG: hypothetical protein LBT41_01370 [Candidatus Methanoplasma sp.]|nr:hypothetical protein [Candidatus Methanoplasma sp.]